MIECRQCEGACAEPYGSMGCEYCGGTGIESCVRCRKSLAEILVDGDPYCRNCAMRDANDFAEQLEANMIKAFGPGWLETGT